MGGIGANHVAQKPLPPSAAYFFCSVVVGLIGALTDVFEGYRSPLFSPPLL